MDFDKTGDVQVNAVAGTSANGDRSVAPSAASGGGGMPSYMAFVILVSGVVGGLILVVVVIMLCKHCSPRHKQQQRGSQELMLQNPVTKPAADDTPNCSVGCGERCLTRPNQPHVPVIKVCSTDAECGAKQSSKITKAALPGLGRPADLASYKTSLSELAQREEGVQRLTLGACGGQPAAGGRRPSSIVIPADSERLTTVAASGLEDCSRSCDAIACETQVMEAADRRPGGVNNASNSSSCNSVDAEIATLTKLPSATATRQATQRPPLLASTVGGNVVHQPIGSLSQTSQSTIHSSMDSADNRSEITVIEAYAPSVVAAYGTASLTPPRLAASVRDDGYGGRSKSFAGHQQNERWPSKARNFLSQDSAHYGAPVVTDSVTTGGARIAAAAKADGGFSRKRGEGGECRGHIPDPSPRRDSFEVAITSRKSPASGNDRERQATAVHADASTSARPHVLPLGASPVGQRSRAPSGALADGKTTAAVAPTSRSRSGDGDLGQQQHAKRGWAASERDVGACRSFDGFQSRSFETQALVHRSPVAADADAVGLSRSPHTATDRRPDFHCNGGGGDNGDVGGGVGKKRTEQMGSRASHELSPPSATERGGGGDAFATGGGGATANCLRSPSASGEVGNRALWVLRSAIELEGRDHATADHEAQPEKDQDAAASADLGSNWRAPLAPRGSSSSSLPPKQLQAQMTSQPLSLITTGQRSEQDRGGGSGSGSGGGMGGRGQQVEERSGSNRSGSQHWEEQRIVAEVPTSETSSSRRARFQSFLVSRARTRLLEVQSSTDRSLDDSFDTASMTEGGTASESSRKNTTSFDSSSTTGAESSTSELPIRRAAAAAAAAVAAASATAVTTTTTTVASAAAADPAAACRDAASDDLRSRRKNGSISLTSKKRRDFQKGRWRSSLDESDCSDTLEEARPRAAGGGFAVGGLLRMTRRGGSARVGAHECQLPARDYSIDEKTDAIFREFVRIDPAYESKQFPCSGGSAAKRAQRFTKRYFSDGSGASADAYYGGGMGCASADGGCLVGAVGLVNLTEEDASEL